MSCTGTLTQSSMRSSVTIYWRPMKLHRNTNRGSITPKVHPQLRRLQRLTPQVPRRENQHRSLGSAAAKRKRHVGKFSLGSSRTRQLISDSLQQVIRDFGRRVCASICSLLDSTKQLAARVKFPDSALLQVCSASILTRLSAAPRQQTNARSCCDFGSW